MHIKDFLGAFQLPNTRLEYVLRRKEFLNQKTFDIFEKFQLLIFSYIGYVISIITLFKDNKFTPADILQLFTIALAVIAFMFVVFSIIHLVNVVEWIKYDKEENIIRGLQGKINLRNILTWIEFWIYIICLFEVAGIACLTRWMLIYLSVTDSFLRYRLFFGP